MDKEREFMDMLERARRIGIAERRLLLYDQTGAPLVRSSPR